MKRVFGRLIAGIVILVIFVCGSLLISTAGVFFSNMSDGVLNIENLSDSDLKKNLPINGKVYYVNTVLAEEYDESDSSNILNYYYLVDFDMKNEIYMIVKVKANSSLDVSLENLYYADLEEGEEYEYLLDEGVAVDGVLIENDSQVISEYDSWKDSISGYGFDMSGAKLASYTLDCTETVSSLCTQFIVSFVILLLLVAALVFIIITLIKQSKASKVQTPVYTTGFTGINGQQNGYNSYNPNASAAPQNGFVPNAPQPQSFQQNGYPVGGVPAQQNVYPSGGAPVQQNGYIPNSPSNQQFIPQASYDRNSQNSQSGQSFIPQSPNLQDSLNQNSQNGTSVDKISLKKEDY